LPLLAENFFVDQIAKACYYYPNVFVLNKNLYVKGGINGNRLLCKMQEQARNEGRAAGNFKKWPQGC